MRVHVVGEGRPLVLLPPFSLDHGVVADVFEPSMAGVAGWARHYIDLPGTGDSPPGRPTSDDVLLELTRSLEATIRGDQMAVAGWSYGGYLALGLTRRMPERVAGLLLVCTGSRIRPAERNLAGVLASTPEPGWLRAVPDRLRGHFEHAVGKQTGAVADRLTGALTRNAPTADTYLDVLRREGFALSDEQASNRFEGPVTLLAGRRDRVAGYREALDRLAELGHADCLVLDEAGHYLPAEQPHLFAAAVRSWLGRCAEVLDRAG